jgi:invasion protein IalB
MISATQAQQPEPVNWVSQCVAPDLSTPLVCTVEQRVIVRETGQQIARVSVQINGDGENRKPALLVHLPLGLSIRAGVALKVDDQEPSALDFQTCDGGGCYAGAALGDALLKKMSKGKILSLIFKDLQQKDISIPISLQGFAAIYDKVK